MKNKSKVRSVVEKGLKTSAVGSKFIDSSFLHLGEGFRFIGIRSRLTIAFVLLTLIPLSITGYMAFQRSSLALENKISLYSSSLAEQIAANISTEMARLESASLDTALDNAVQLSLDRWATLDNIEMLDATREIRSVVNMKSITNKAIRSPILYINASTYFGTKDAAFDDSHFQALIEAGKGSRGVAAWQFVTNNEEEPVLMLNRIVQSISTGREHGILSLTINPAGFVEILNAVDLGEGSELHIFDEDGNVVASTDETYVFGAPYHDPILLDTVEKAIVENEISFDYTDRVKRSLVTYSLIGESGWTLIAKVPHSFLIAESVSLGNTILLIGFLSLLLSVLLSLLITDSIANPLKNLINAMKEGKKGNLAYRITDKHKDEISNVAKNYNQMMANIHELVTGVRQASIAVLDSSDKIADSSSRSQETAEQIARTVEEIAKGATHQARDISEGVGQLSSLSERIANASKGMQVVSGVVMETQELSGQAATTVKLLNDRALETSSAAERIQTDIKRLHSDMNEIGSITRTIAGIAEQTNLLALNAAIEAARAGEAGRGFAVVSGEIRKLAEQSRNASVNINKILSSIRENTEQTVKEAELTTSIIEKQMTAVRDTDFSFRTIQASMDRISGQMADMDRLISNVLDSKNKAVIMFGDVAAVSEETAATTEEVSAGTQEQISESELLATTAAELQEMARRLNDGISKFQI